MLLYFQLPAFCIAFLLVILSACLEYRILIWLILGASFALTVLSKRVGGFFLLGGLLAIGVFQFEFSHFRESKGFSDGKYQAYVYQRELRKNNKQRITIEIKGEKLLATLNRYPIIQKGDVIEIDCVFSKPQPFSGFAYDKYLYAQGIQQLCEVKSVEVVHHQAMNIFEQGRISFAHKIRSLWARPTSSLAAGLLLGTRESFSQTVLENFSRSGVTHIIALSGFNIAILIIFFEKIFLKLTIPRFYRLCLISVSIVLFTFFVGAGASIVRAAIMGSVAYIAAYYGRSGQIWRIMLFTAFCMTILNPFVLAFDVGFQLSFLSTIGLVYLTPLFTKIFGFLPEVFSLRESFTTTMAATVGTLPLILFQFGNLSTVSPFANVLILPVIPWLMLTSFFGVMIPYLSQPFVFLSTLGARYVLRISELFASPEWASIVVEFDEIGFFFSCMLVGILILLSRKYV